MERYQPGSGPYHPDVDSQHWSSESRLITEVKMLDAAIDVLSISYTTGCLLFAIICFLSKDSTVLFDCDNLLHINAADLLDLQTSN